MNDHEAILEIRKDIDNLVERVTRLEQPSSPAAEDQPEHLGYKFCPTCKGKFCSTCKGRGVVPTTGNLTDGFNGRPTCSPEPVQHDKPNLEIRIEALKHGILSPEAIAKIHHGAEDIRAGRVEPWPKCPTCGAYSSDQPAVPSVVCVVVANDEATVKVCEVYVSADTAWERFAELKKVYGGANVCLSSRAVIGMGQPAPAGGITEQDLERKYRLATEANRLLAVEVAALKAKLSQPSPATLSAEVEQALHTGNFLNLSSTELTWLRQRLAALPQVPSVEEIRLFIQHAQQYPEYDDRKTLPKDLHEWLSRMGRPAFGVTAEKLAEWRWKRGREDGTGWARLVKPLKDALIEDEKAFLKAFPLRSERPELPSIPTTHEFYTWANKEWSDMALPANFYTRLYTWLASRGEGATTGEVRLLRTEFRFCPCAREVVEVGYLCGKQICFWPEPWQQSEHPNGNMCEDNLEELSEVEQGKVWSGLKKEGKRND